MKRAGGILVVVALALVASHAHAAAKFTLLDHQVTRALPKPVRANVSSMVRLGLDVGTGVLLDRTQGLVLTNHHVATSQTTPLTVRYRDGQIAKIHEVLLANPQLDYALLRVEPPTSASIHAAKIRDGVVSERERVYAVSAVPSILRRDLVDANLHVTDPQRFIDAHLGTINAGRTGGKRLLALARQVARFGVNHSYPTIQWGRESGKGTLWGVDFGQGPIWSLKTSLPNAPGASGSPVFSARTHELIGLHFSGDETKVWESSEVSMVRIMDELRARAVDPSVPFLTRQRLHGLIDPLQRAR